MIPLLHGKKKRSMGSSSKSVTKSKSKASGSSGLKIEPEDSTKTAEQMNRIRQAVGMNQTDTGKAGAIERLLTKGSISEQEALQLIEHFGLKVDG